MKAPEKIYVNITHPISDEYTEIIAFEDGEGIEYTRTDAIIEKAATWFANRYQVNGYLDADDIEDFKNYMKGE